MNLQKDESKIVLVLVSTLVAFLTVGLLSRLLRWIFLFFGLGVVVSGQVPNGKLWPHVTIDPPNTQSVRVWRVTLTPDGVMTSSPVTIGSGVKLVENSNGTVAAVVANPIPPANTLRWSWMPLEMRFPATSACFGAGVVVHAVTQASLISADGTVKLYVSNQNLPSPWFSLSENGNCVTWLGPAGTRPDGTVMFYVGRVP